MADNAARKAEARKMLAIPDGARAILCLDGGGVRGVLTVQMLKRLEEVAGAPCHEIFDMVSGTSTGGIIAGLIASGKSAPEINDFYESLLTDVFLERSMLSTRFVNPPKYSKKKYRELLKKHINDTTIRSACEANGVDLLITAKDVAAGEETFFSYLRGRDPHRNIYGAVLLRSAMEATMSAPTFFNPLERFVDGGVTTHNNPSLAAVIEAVAYGPPKGHTLEYKRNNLVVFSFGTGVRPRVYDVDNIERPKGIDTIFWLEWLLSEAGDDASDMQVYLFNSVLMEGINYRRFQISLRKEMIMALVDQLDQEWVRQNTPELLDVSDKTLESMEMDDVDKRPLLTAIGAALAEHIVRTQDPPFSTGLVKLGTSGAPLQEVFVYHENPTQEIRKNLSDPKWLDGRLF